MGFKNREHDEMLCGFGKPRTEGKKTNKGKDLKKKLEEELTGGGVWVSGSKTRFPFRERVKREKWGERRTMLPAVGGVDLRCTRGGKFRLPQNKRKTGVVGRERKIT